MRFVDREIWLENQQVDARSQRGARAASSSRSSSSGNLALEVKLDRAILIARGCGFQNAAALLTCKKSCEISRRFIAGRPLSAPTKQGTGGANAAWGGKLESRGPPADLDKLLHLLGSLWPGIRATSPVPLEGQVAMVTINRRPSA